MADDNLHCGGSVSTASDSLPQNTSLARRALCEQNRQPAAEMRYKFSKCWCWSGVFNTGNAKKCDLCTESLHRNATIPSRCPGERSHATKCTITTECWSIWYYWGMPRLIPHNILSAGLYDITGGCPDWFLTTYTECWSIWYYWGMSRLIPHNILSAGLYDITGGCPDWFLTTYWVLVYMILLGDVQTDSSQHTECWSIWYYWGMSRLIPHNILSAGLYDLTGGCPDWFLTTYWVLVYMILLGDAQTDSSQHTECWSIWYYWGMSRLIPHNILSAGLYDITGGCPDWFLTTYWVLVYMILLGDVQTDSSRHTECWSIWYYWGMPRLIPHDILSAGLYDITGGCPDWFLTTYWVLVYMILLGDAQTDSSRHTECWSIWYYWGMSRLIPHNILSAGLYDITGGCPDWFLTTYWVLVYMILLVDVQTDSSRHTECWSIWSYWGMPRLIPHDILSAGLYDITGGCPDWFLTTYWVLVYMILLGDVQTDSSRHTECWSIWYYWGMPRLIPHNILSAGLYDITGGCPDWFLTTYWVLVYMILLGDAQTDSSQHTECWSIWYYWGMPRLIPHNILSAGLYDITGGCPDWFLTTYWVLVYMILLGDVQTDSSQHTECWSIWYYWGMSRLIPHNILSAGLYDITGGCPDWFLTTYWVLVYMILLGDVQTDSSQHTECWSIWYYWGVSRLIPHNILSAGLYDITGGCPDWFLTTYWVLVYMILLGDAQTDSSQHTECWSIWYYWGMSRLIPHNILSAGLYDITGGCPDWFLTTYWVLVYMILLGDVQTDSSQHTECWSIWYYWGMPRLIPHNILSAGLYDITGGCPDWFLTTYWVLVYMILLGDVQTDSSQHTECWSIWYYWGMPRLIPHNILSAGLYDITGGCPDWFLTTYWVLVYMILLGDVQTDSSRHTECWSIWSYWGMPRLIPHNILSAGLYDITGGCPDWFLTTYWVLVYMILLGDVQTDSSRHTECWSIWYYWGMPRLIPHNILSAGLYDITGGCPDWFLTTYWVLVYMILLGDAQTDSSQHTECWSIWYYWGMSRLIPHDILSAGLYDITGGMSRLIPHNILSAGLYDITGGCPDWFLTTYWVLVYTILLGGCPDWFLTTYWVLVYMILLGDVQTDSSRHTECWSIWYYWGMPRLIPHNILSAGLYDITGGCPDWFLTTYWVLVYMILLGDAQTDSSQHTECWSIWYYWGMPRLIPHNILSAGLYDITGGCPDWFLTTYWVLVYMILLGDVQTDSSQHTECWSIWYYWGMSRLIPHNILSAGLYDITGGCPDWFLTTYWVLVYMILLGDVQTDSSQHTECWSIWYYWGVSRLIPHNILSAGLYDITGGCPDWFLTTYWVLVYMILLGDAQTDSSQHTECWSIWYYWGMSRLIPHNILSAGLYDITGGCPDWFLTTYWVLVYMILLGDVQTDSSQHTECWSIWYYWGMPRLIPHNILSAGLYDITGGCPDWFLTTYWVLVYMILLGDVQTDSSQHTECWSIWYYWGMPRLIPHNILSAGLYDITGGCPDWFLTTYWVLVYMILLGDVQTDSSRHTECWSIWSYWGMPRLIPHNILSAGLYDITGGCPDWFLTTYWVLVYMILLGDVQTDSSRHTECWSIWYYWGMPRLIPHNILSAGLYDITGGCPDWFLTTYWVLVYMILLGDAQTDSSQHTECWSIWYYWGMSRLIPHDILSAGLYDITGGMSRLIPHNILSAGLYDITGGCPDWFLTTYWVLVYTILLGGCPDWFLTTYWVLVYMILLGDVQTDSSRHTECWSIWYYWGMSRLIPHNILSAGLYDITGGCPDWFLTTYWVLVYMILLGDVQTDSSQHTECWSIWYYWGMPMTRLISPNMQRAVLIPAPHKGSYEIVYDFIGYTWHSFIWPSVICSTHMPPYGDSDMT